MTHNNQSPMLTVNDLADMASSITFTVEQEWRLTGRRYKGEAGITYVNTPVSVGNRRRGPTGSKHTLWRSRYAEVPTMALAVRRARDWARSAHATVTISMVRADFDPNSFQMRATTIVAMVSEDAFGRIWVDSTFYGSVLI